MRMTRYRHDLRGIRAPSVSRLIPRCRLTHGLAQAGVGLGWCVEPGKKLPIGLGTNGDHCAVEQCLLGGEAGSFEDEIRAVLAPSLCRAVNETAGIGLDADIESLAPLGTRDDSHQI